MGRFLDISAPNEPLRSPGDFCLADPQGDTAMAYSFGTDEHPTDPALAEGHSEMPLRFTPIDHNPDFEQLEQSRNKRCDGYLRSEDASTLIFTELKNRGAGNETSTKSWIEKAIAQLRQTIVLFRNEEPEKAKLDANGCHRAYVCNPKGPYRVPESVRSVKRMFLTATRNFMLFCTNKIDVNEFNTVLHSRMETGSVNESKT